MEIQRTMTKNERSKKLKRKSLVWKLKIKDHHRPDVWLLETAYGPRCRVFGWYCPSCRVWLKFLECRDSQQVEKYLRQILNKIVKVRKNK